MSKIDLIFRKTSTNVPGGILTRNTSLFVPGVAGGFIQATDDMIPGQPIGDPAYDTSINVHTRYVTKGQSFLTLAPPSSSIGSVSVIGILFVWSLSAAFVNGFTLQNSTGLHDDSTNWTSLGRFVNGGYAVQAFYQLNKNYTYGTLQKLTANMTGTGTLTPYLMYKNVAKTFAGIGNIGFLNIAVDIGGIQGTPLSNTSNVLSPTTNPLSSGQSTLISQCSGSTMLLAPNSLGVGSILHTMSPGTGSNAWSIPGGLSGPATFNTGAGGGWYQDNTGYSVVSNTYGDEANTFGNLYGSSGWSPNNTDVPSFTRTKLEVVGGANVDYSGGVSTGISSITWKATGSGSSFHYSPTTPILRNPLWDLVLQCFVEIKGYYSYP
jgi:hypothetical protein